MYDTVHLFVCRKMYIHGEGLDYALLSSGLNAYCFEWVSCWNWMQNVNIFQFFLIINLLCQKC